MTEERVASAGRSLNGPGPALRSEPTSAELRAHWLLDPSVTFLNHGSFGACPGPVLEAQGELRARMEREPVQFFVHELPARIETARGEAARFVGARPEHVSFVRNVTHGVNAVLRSLALSPGDELLTTDHGYNACRNVLEHVAARAGARVVVAPIPFPIASPDEVTQSILAHATERTRLALVDHVTSPTGLVLPIADIIRELDRQGIDTLVDGAHGPGMLPLDLDALGAAYYTANFHKWVCAPKGAGLLHVRADRQAGLHPALISHGYDFPLRGRSRFHVEFDWTGTDDVTGWLCVPEAIRCLDEMLPGGWDAIRRRNRETVLQGRRIVCAALGQEPPAPESMIGSLAAVPLPDGPNEPPTSFLYANSLQRALFDHHRVEVPVPPWPAPPKRLLRLSAHLYNEPADYEKLAGALEVELG